MTDTEAAALLRIAEDPRTGWGATA
jgi:hypothetical protein